MSNPSRLMGHPSTDCCLPIAFVVETPTIEDEKEKKNEKNENEIVSAHHMSTHRAIQDTFANETRRVRNHHGLHCTVYSYICTFDGLQNTRFSLRTHQTFELCARHMCLF